MILSDTDIRKSIFEGRVVIDPLPDFDVQLGPCSVDFHLGNTFKIFDYSKHPVIDPRQKQIFDSLTREVHVEDDQPFIVHPGELIIAVTKEWLELDATLIGRLEGRSSLGRIGIVVHSTAARFDPGWIGRPVLELGNLGRIPVSLYPGMRICAFTFEELSSPANIVYSKRATSKYVGQQTAIPSRISDEQ